MNNDLFVTLDNGLKVLVYSDKSKVTNYVRLITLFGGNTSSYCNGKYIVPGTAHLLEHYVCENSINGNMIDLLKKKGVLGANAGTSAFDTTFYFDTVYDLEDNLKMFLESFYNPVFTKEKLEKTKNAVYSEIRDDKDNYNRKIGTRKIKNIFFNTRHTLGSKSDIKKISTKYLKDVYNNFYVPANEVLVVAGNFDTDKIMALITDFYKGMEFKNNVRSERVLDKREVVRKKDIIYNGEMEEVLVSYKIDITKMSNYDKYKLDWYVSIFGDINFSRFSKFNEIIKEDEDFVGDVCFSNYIYNGYMILEIAAYTRNEDKFLDLIEEVIRDFKTNTIDEFNMIIRDMRTRISVRKDSIMGYVGPILSNYFDFDYPGDDTLDFIDGLEFQEYIDTIGKIDFTNVSLFAIKKEKKGNNNS